MRNIPVWGKIALGLAAASVITLAIAAVGYLGIEKTGNALGETVQRRMPVQQHLAVLRHALTGIQRAERTLLIPEAMENPALLASQRADLAKYWGQAEAALSAHEALPGGNPETEAWLEFKDAWAAWGARHRKVL